MSYKVTKKEDAVTYYPDQHYDMRATRLHAPEDVDGKLMLAMSHFLPAGGAEKMTPPVEQIYYMLEGEMTVTTDDGVSHVLHAGDSIHFGAGVGKESKNTGIVTAQWLVIVCTK